MQVQSTNFTVAEYYEQMRSGSIVINRQYQRREGVWPENAQTYLIDTILQGFPIPKIALYQKTDLKTKKTIKEIIDGQQRSSIIRRFLEDSLVLTSVSKEFAGKRFSDLDDEAKQKFIDYTISADIFIGATDEDIRELFRRINSYSYPLNDQEQRYASYQGKFKWFIVDLSDRFSKILIDLNVLNEHDVVRMKDTKLFSEISLAIDQGFGVKMGKKQLDKLYQKYDTDFPEESKFRDYFELGFNSILDLRELHSTSILHKYYQFYSFFLALIHCQKPIEKLNSYFDVKSPISLNRNLIEQNVSRLNDVLENADGSEDFLAETFKSFIEASSKATTDSQRRATRFKFFCRAITGNL